MFNVYTKIYLILIILKFILYQILCLMSEFSKYLFLDIDNIDDIVILFLFKNNIELNFNKLVMGRENLTLQTFKFFTSDILLYINCKLLIQSLIFIYIFIL